MIEKTAKAGAIILSSKNKSNLALLYRGQQNDWSFPKGHINKDENPEQAMIREIKEETGLNINILQVLPDLEYKSSAGETSLVKMFFVISLDDSNLKLEFKNDNILWLPYDEVVEKLTYDNLKEYFSSILPIVKKYIFLN